MVRGSAKANYSTIIEKIVSEMASRIAKAAHTASSVVVIILVNTSSGRAVLMERTKKGVHPHGSYRPVYTTDSVSHSQTASTERWHLV